MTKADIVNEISKTTGIEKADLTDADGSYGVSVLNDSKYDWDKPVDNTLRLTLLHTPATKGGYAYQNKQDFGHHTFTYSIVGHARCV